MCRSSLVWFSDLEPAYDLAKAIGFPKGVLRGLVLLT